MPLSPQQAAQELLLRRSARKDFRSWCLLRGWQPAKHHDLIIAKLQQLVDDFPDPTTKKFKHKRKVMLLMPPGSAKSTYTSKEFIPWFLGHCPGSCILASSYSKDLINSFGRAGRNIVEQNSNTLGYELEKDTRASDEWETTNGGRYFCAGTGAGIAGHRFDFGLIDDPIGTEEQANSKTHREKLGQWYLNDFTPRAKPDAVIFIIANRRHEQDLCGQLLNKTEDFPNGLAGDSDEWDVISIPFRAEFDNDPLGRQKGETLWPEYFNEAFIRAVDGKPAKTRAGLYQQRPCPETGNFFDSSTFEGYRANELPPLNELKIYITSDHAISKKEEANKSCFGVWGVDSKDNLWLLPEIFWRRADASEQVEAMIKLAKKYSPICWYAEKVHITQAIGPFLSKRKRETKVYFNVKEITSKKDKRSRASSIEGRMSMHKVFFPKFASWWDDAEYELLTFDGGKDDDFVDMCGLIGKALNSLSSGEEAEVDDTPKDINVNQTPCLNFAWLKQQARNQRLKEEVEVLYN